MSLVFAARSNTANFEALRTPGQKLPALFGNPVPLFAADATAIGGSRFNLDNGVVSNRFLIYDLGKNPFSSQARSLLLRISFGATNQSQGLCDLGSGIIQAGPLRLGFYYMSTVQLGVATTDALSATNYFASTAYAFSTDTWYDLVLVWDGVSGVNKVLSYVNGVLLASGTAAGTSLPNPLPDWGQKNLTIGIGGTQTTARYSINEVCLWNGVIDPTNVALVGGTGSLNGAARTAFVDAVSFEGGLYTNPGIANVSSGTDYVYAGSTLTGSLSVACDYPIAGNVRSNTSYASGSLTGTLIVPAAADVRTGVSVDATVGSLDVEQENITVEVEDYESITVTVEDQA